MIKTRKLEYKNENFLATTFEYGDIVLFKDDKTKGICLSGKAINNEIDISECLDKNNDNNILYYDATIKIENNLYISVDGNHNNEILYHFENNSYYVVHIDGTANHIIGEKTEANDIDDYDYKIIMSN